MVQSRTAALSQLPAHIVVLLLIALDIVARAARSSYLLDVPVPTAARINMMGDAIAYITPLRLGGEPLRYVAFTRAGAAAPRVLASFAVEIVIDAILLVVVAAALGAVFEHQGLAGLERLVALLRDPSARWVAGLTALAALLCALIAVRLSRRLPVQITTTLKDAWQVLRTIPPRLQFAATWTTLLSIAARTAILPVLAMHVPDLSLGGVVLGSYALMYGQMMLPTPAGAGGVELGFIAGFEDSLDAPARAELLALWRFYTLVLPVALGFLLMARAGLLRREPNAR